jgi:TetR/AcrR family transcriptional repressor of nem operon
MKVTREQSAENRAKLIETASRLFREHGIDGVGVAEICKQAGLTHGALYAQFPTKQALAAEAMAYAQELGYQHLMKTEDDGPPTLDHFLAYYLSPETRDDIANSCAMAASASEVGRQDNGVSASFGEGFTKLAKVIESTLAPASAVASSRERALTITVALIGGLSVARGVHKANAALSEEVLHALGNVLGALGARGKRDKAKATGTARKKRKPAAASAPERTGAARKKSPRKTAH